jgi:hypothetical protein
MPDPSVEITQSGRGGSIYYHEGTRTISFDWEFAASPALVLINGPSAAVWGQMHVWAAGRQSEIYSLVGEEVIRQKAPGYRFDSDIENGSITIYPKHTGPGPALMEAQRTKKSPRDKRTKAYKRFMASVPKGFEGWGDEQCYDVAALPQMTAAERKEIFALLQGRDPTWREVEAFAAIPTADAREAIQAALTHHLSIDARLAAADALDRQGSMENVESFLARQIRLLNNPREGLRRALAMAERHPTATIKQALLWASYNQTECAPHCARLLIKLTGAAREPLGKELEEMLTNLGLHNSYFTRQAAFEKLCKLVGIEFDPSAADM